MEGRVSGAIWSYTRHQVPGVPIQGATADHPMQCNKYLANIRIKQENTCTYCEEVNSIQHFLFECDNTKLLLLLLLLFYT